MNDTTKQEIVPHKKTNVILNKLQQSINNKQWENTIKHSEQLIDFCLNQLLSEKIDYDIAPEKFTVLGDFLLNKGNIAGALACYNKATEFKEKLSQFYEIIGKDYLKNKQFLPALDMFNKAITYGSKSPELYANLGTIYINLQDVNKAIIYYQKSLELNSKLPGVYRNLARLHEQIGKIQEAKSYWYQAFILENDLHTDTEYYELGNKFLQENELKKAIFSYQRSIELNPENEWAYDVLGQILVKTEQKNEAVKIYTKFGFILFTKKYYKQAIESYKRAIELSKSLGSIDDYLIDAYKQAITNYTDSSGSEYFELGKLLRSQGNFDEAVDAFMKTLKLSPNLTETYTYLQYTQLSDQKIDEIIDFYQSLVAKNPKKSIIWQNLGDVLTQKGNLEEAIICYQKSCYYHAIKIKPQLSEFNWKSRKEKGPDFLIIGSAKSGTSSLYKYISSHPQSLLPHRKEIAFFSQNYHYGVEWYLAHFPVMADYPEYITGEATPAYLRFTEAESRVYHLFPETKLIVLLRNPVEQLISWHYHKVNTGLYQKTLKQAIADELKPINDLSEEKIMDILVHQKYNLMGCLYYYHLKRWMQYFPREQFLIIKSEDFFVHTNQVMQDVYKFLGICSYEMEKYAKINVGYYPNVSQEIRSHIADYCRPHNQKLEELLGMEFNWDNY
jgi:tetratricopeptide (TPR) repeat protein